jgi:hypothetical protein
MLGMTDSRTFRLLVLLVSGVLLAALAVPAALAGTSKRRASVEITGFRASGSRIVDPGGTIERACAPKRLIAYVAFKNVRRGALVKRRWRMNGDLVKATNVAWDHSRKRRVVRLVIFNPRTLPHGQYKIAVRATGAPRWTVGTVKLAC